MRGMRAIRYVVLISLLWLGPASFAQTVIVRVVNGSNERALRKQEVSVSLRYYKGEPTPAKYDAHLTLQTDENGEIRFLLPDPPPRDLYVRVPVDWRRWQCGCNLLLSTEDVIQKGIVDPAARDYLKRRPALLKPVPGEIRFC